jgi:hypothetical protein
MKIALRIIGALVLLYGLHWIGQGTGWLPWPAGTIMDYNMNFTWAGLVLVAVGGALIWAGRR